MTTTSKPEKRTLTDEALGAFRYVPPSPTLDHAVRYLSTWSGTDKLLMITQYGSQVVMAVLLALHRFRARLHLARSPESKLVPRIRNLYALVADARILFRIWGILPMIQWMISMERVPPPNRYLHTIERLQGWSMVIYCPMEAAAYLAMHKIINLSDRVQNKLWLWGCRFWLLYVVLQLAHVVEDNRLLRLRSRALEKSRGHPAPKTKDGEAVELNEEQKITSDIWQDIENRKEALVSELWVNLGYLPLTLHWSVESGIISDFWVGVFGTIAAASGMRMGWKASA
ncbi:hypothetical protein MCUN1_001243 [Malassezia cuniculi]|uniref:Peroxisomal biogenesis factor 11 n=1 Tax=Malassezia cuniculi TaxID=948313 RepID=A0AAF0EX93_9BASI|nr:hypothetical protein MCUN1_001243 [Malassezia cuniculi]